MLPTHWNNFRYFTKYLKLFQLKFKNLNEGDKDENMASTITYECQFCKATFNHKTNLYGHLKTARYCLELQGKNTDIRCEFCDKQFSTKKTCIVHRENCSERVQAEHEQNMVSTVKQYEEKISQLVDQYEEKLSKCEQQCEERIATNSLRSNEKIAFLEANLTEKDQLIEKLWLDRDSDIHRFSSKVPSNISERLDHLMDDPHIIEPIHMSSLTLNGVQINSRHPDHYVNVSELCMAGEKRFIDWSRLDTSNDVLTVLSHDTGISVPLLIESKRGSSCEYEQGTWIHPELAIQVAQWLSPTFGIQVSRWVKSLYNSETALIDVKMVKMYQQRNEKLEVCLKRKRRLEHNQKNVVYLLTTADHIKRQIYIVGKAKDLTSRLVGYNKTCEHIVVYNRQCPTEEDMSMAEAMVLSRLRAFREQANRDRFILPSDKDESFFISVIDDCVDFVCKK